MNVQLEKIARSDFENYFQLVSNAEVMKMITTKPLDLEEAKSDFNTLIKKNELNPNYGKFKIVNTETNKVLGIAKLEASESNVTAVEIGYMLLPDYWGKGIASTMAKLLVENGKKQNSIKNIIAIIDPENIASRKILTKNGFALKEHKIIDGLQREVLQLKIGNSN
ncbi:GNAT family N-acetyltransferase [Cellulophaga baltica]|uniref:GNAT family N-acetyltransferase n=1 Tax=Cellulophaga TaxID=104264 RepID=UPI001C079E90|nr:MULTISPECIES: GNAT family N-acetyltransferase [Cellulophaga]MBU2998044.1 GNAT family N-acetyltransferase [Cellulophaga baltica]MDO6769445.1 GNAT family N-acetyltransferase [Cellulophaga sp. 1_MG-2023]